ncbi:MAG: hypothetical protein WD342_12240 [Verrucomicrobiales bacterium]
MKDKASAKNEGTEGESPADSDLEEPGIPPGEELSLDPEDGDRLDPIADRWWDDADASEKEVRQNRKLEEGETIEGLSEAKASPSESEPVDRKSEGEETAEPAEGNAVPEPASDEPDKTPEAAAEKPDGPKSSELDELLGAEPRKGESPKKEKPDLSELVGPASSSRAKISEAEVSKEHGAAEGAGQSETPVVALGDPAQSDESTSVPAAARKPMEAGPLEGGATAKPEEIAFAAMPPSPEPAEMAGGKTGASQEPGGAPDTASAEAEPVESAAVSGDPPSKKGRAGCWTVFATIFFIAALLLVVAIAVGGAVVWAKRGDLEAEIAATAARKLEERGIHLDYEGWRYQFPRGLVLENVTVYETAARERPSIKASDVGVNIDVLGLAVERATGSGAEISLADSDVSFFEGGEVLMAVENVDGEVLVDRDRLRVERFSAHAEGLRIEASGVVKLSERNGTGGGAKGRSDRESPKALSLDFSAFEQLQRWLAVVPEGEPPVLKVDFEMDGEDPDSLALAGTLTGRDFAWRGVSVESVAAVFDFDPTAGILRFDNFQLGYGGGFVGGVFTVDTEAGQVAIEKGQSTVDLIALFSDYDAELGEKLEDVSFADAPTVRFSGNVPFETPKEARLQLDWEHRRGLVYHSRHGDLPIRDLRGRINVKDGVLETNDFAVALLGGQVEINGISSLDAEGSPFSGLIEISGMSLSEVAAHYDKEDIGMTGNLYLTFRGIGHGDVARIRGGGTIRVDEAQLSSFPVVGPVQELLGRVVPALGFDGRGTVTGAYIVESGVLVTNDFTVVNPEANLLVNGSVKLAEQTTDFTAVASLNDALAAATDLEDKTIEVHGTGALASPELTVSDFPVEFAAEKLGEVLGTSPETLGTLKEILGDGENAAEVISGKIEEATGLELGDEVNELLKGLLEPKPEEKPPIRATVVEPE